MHWGHAVSRDLMTWEHRGAALEPDVYGTVYSGCGWPDRENTAGFGEDALGITELRFSLQITGTGTFRDFNIIANFYHNETDTQEFYNANSYIASPAAGSYAVMDVSGAPTRVQFSDYATMRYYYREDGQLHEYYFDFRNALVNTSPYPKQKLL